jgi:hypothetical protein
MPRKDAVEGMGSGAPERTEEPEPCPDGGKGEDFHRPSTQPFASKSSGRLGQLTGSFPLDFRARSFLRKVVSLAHVRRAPLSSGTIGRQQWVDTCPNRQRCNQATGITGPKGAAAADAGADVPVERPRTTTTPAETAVTAEAVTVGRISHR